MNIGTLIEEDEFRNTLSFIRGKECQCAMLLHRTRLRELCYGRDVPGLILALRTRPGLLMSQKYDLLEWAHRNQWLPWKDSQVCYRLV